MSIDKDSVGIDDSAPVERPPAVSERLWNLIAPENQRSWRIAAAMGLRKGIHPETTIISMLVEDGWDPDQIDASLSPSLYLNDPDDYDDHDGYDDFPGASPSASTAISPSVAAPIKAEAHVADGPPPFHPPLWAYGTEGYKRPWEPVGEIGGILHYACGFDGPTAAEMEWQLHRAIARDPSFVRKDPANIALLGCVLPADVMPSIRASVLFECDCVIDDIRRRRSAGDLAAMLWIDPDEFVL